MTTAVWLMTILAVGTALGVVRAVIERERRRRRVNALLFTVLQDQVASEQAMFRSMEALSEMKQALLGRLRVLVGELDSVLGQGIFDESV